MQRGVLAKVTLLLVTTMVVPSIVTADSVEAPSLFWQAKSLPGSNVDECLSEARMAIESHRWLTEIRQVRPVLWAWGDGLKVSIGCLQSEGEATSAETTAVIMVAGQNREATQKLRDSLISKWPIRIDSGVVAEEIQP